MNLDIFFQLIWFRNVCLSLRQAVFQYGIFESEEVRPLIKNPLNIYNRNRMKFLLNLYNNKLWVQFGRIYVCTTIKCSKFYT